MIGKAGISSNFSYVFCKFKFSYYIIQIPDEFGVTFISLIPAYIIVINKSFKLFINKFNIHMKRNLMLQRYDKIIVFDNF